MKKNNVMSVHSVKLNIHTVILIAAKNLFLTVIATGLFASCQKDLTTGVTGGKLKDEAQLDAAPALTLRSPKSADGVVNIILTKGAGSVSERIYISSASPSDLSKMIILQADTTLVEPYRQKNRIDYKVLPEAFYKLDGGSCLDIAIGELESSSGLLKIYLTNPLGNVLESGRYLLPIVATSSTQKVSRELYYDIILREPFESDAELYTGDDAFFIFYINTEYYDPRLVTDYYMTATDRKTFQEAWYNTVGNIVNLRKATIGWDYDTGSVVFQLGTDLRYVLDHQNKYIQPLKESGRKICISIEGANTGVGFCNLSDEQIQDFSLQVKQVVDYFALDGVNLWDRLSGYGLPDAIPTNTTSYPKLIKTLREMLGPDKLLTLVDHETPTEYFWDIKATGGIAVGDYIDYAWSGYCDRDEGYQVIDPYHPDAEEVSNLHPRKPILNLSPSKYGCINAPWGVNSSQISTETSSKVKQWSKKGLNPNYICVYEDLRTNLQDKLEGKWGVYMLVHLYHSSERKYMYYDDQTRLWNGTASGYNKWCKDW